METSALYKEIIADPLHWEENKIVMGDGNTAVEYFEDEIEDISTSYGAFGGSALTIGAAVMGQCTAVMRREGINAAQFSQEIGRGARVRPFVRVATKQIDKAASAITGLAVAGKAVVGEYEHEAGTVYSEWLQQGDYNVDTRDAAAWSSKLTLFCVDKMQRAEADYPSTTHSWPYRDIRVVEEIATAMGVEIDPITYTVMTGGYDIQLPTAYSMRETLGYIAAMYGGNFIITKSGKLLLLTLGSLPESTHYLVNETGYRLVVGGVRILV